MHDASTSNRAINTIQIQFADGVSDEETWFCDWNASHKQESLSPSWTAPRHHTQPPVETMSTQVLAVKQQMEQDLDAYLETELPSLQSLGAGQTFQDVFHRHEVEIKSDPPCNLIEEKGVDVKTTTFWTKEKAAQQKAALLAADAAAAANDPSYLRPTPRMNHMVALSGVPNNQQYNVAAVHDGEDGDPDTGVDEANPYIVQEDHDGSLVSGLTTVSPADNNRRILQDCERSVASFLRKEHNAIQNMMLQELDKEEESSEEYCSEIGSTATIAADQAENMVQQMREMLDEFSSKNSAVNKSDHEMMGAIMPASKKKETTSQHVHMDNPEERGVSTHERSTNEPQREQPSDMVLEDGDVVGDGDLTSISEQTKTEVLSHDHAVPESLSKQYRSRYAMYLDQRRKARERRAMMRIAAVTAILSLILVGLGYYYYEYRYLSTVMLRRQEAAAAALAEQYHRPWLCNVPLAYLVHDRCNRLASENPVFDLHALVQALMQ